MSTKRSSSLRGYPVFYPPEFTEQITKYFASNSINNSIRRMELKQAGDLVTGFIECKEDPRTGNYGWYSGLEFKRENARFMILFPWLTSSDPLTLDRKVELYSTKRIPLPQVQKLVSDLQRAFVARESVGQATRSA